MIDIEAFVARLNTIIAKVRQRTIAETYDATYTGIALCVSGIRWGDTSGTNHIRSKLRSMQQSLKSPSGWAVAGETLNRTKLPSLYTWDTDAPGVDGPPPNGEADTVSLAREAGIPLWSTGQRDFTRKFPAEFIVPSSVYGNEVITDEEVGYTPEQQLYVYYVPGFNNHTAYPLAWTTGDIARALVGTYDSFADAWSPTMNGITGIGVQQGGLIYQRSGTQWNLVNTDNNAQPKVLSAPGLVERGDYIGEWLLDELEAILPLLTRTYRSTTTVTSKGWYGVGSSPETLGGTPSWSKAKQLAQDDWLTEPESITDGFYTFGSSNVDGFGTIISYQAQIHSQEWRVSLDLGTDPPEFAHTVRTGAYGDFYDTGDVNTWDDNGTGLLEHSYSQMALLEGPLTGDTQIAQFGDALAVPAWTSAPGPGNSHLRGCLTSDTYAVLDWTFPDPSVEPETPPTAPTGLTATAISEQQIDLTWTDNSNDETGFWLQRRKTSGTGWQTVDVFPANTTNYSDTGLESSTEYEYRVLARKQIDSIGRSPIYNSSWSNYATATTTALPAPSGLTATANGETQIDLAWTDTTSTEKFFIIERSLDNTTWESLVTLPANTIAYSDTGLTGGTTYYYRIRAQDGGGYSAYTSTANAQP